MRFLLDADLPRSTAGVVRKHGHDAIDVRDIGLRTAKDSQIAAHALREGLCLITGDFDFADIRNYPPENYPGIVVLELPNNATARLINSLLDQLLSQRDLLIELPGKLAVVAPGRVRLR